MKCLVTGGAGFIGSHLVDRLRLRQHHVDIVDDERGHNGDASLSTWLARQTALPYQWIFHLAAVARTVEALECPLLCHWTNATVSLALLETVRKYCPLTRVVLASSNIVYGSPNSYRASKLAMEESMLAYNHCYGLNCIALRYSNVYGPRMKWDDPICLASMRRSAHERGYIELTGDGSQSRDFTHVSDIVDGTILAAQSDFKGIVDLTSEDHHSMNEMAQFFQVPVRYIPARVGDTQQIRQSADSARRLFDWDAKIGLAAGMRDVLADVPQGVRA